MSSPVTREMIEEFILQAERKGDLQKANDLRESLKNFKEAKPEMHHIEEEGGRHIVSLGGPPLVRTCGTPPRKLVKVEK